MKLIILFIIFEGINLYLIGETESYMIINSKNFSLDLIPYKNGLHSDLEKNEISVTNNLFYYITFEDIYWENILIKYKNTFFTLYLENMNAFKRYYLDIIQEKKIKVIIIGVDPNFDKNEIKLDEINKYIFINKNQNDIKSKFSTFSINNICSTFITFYYQGDIIFDDLVTLSGFFIILFLLVYAIVCYNYRKHNDKYLFIQDYILAVLFFYFFHTLFLYLITTKKKYKYFDEDTFSGALYIILNILQFFVKLLPNIFASIQVNIFEVREHSSILGNSKVIHLLSCIIFFIISFQKENTYLSEMLNCFFYFVNFIGILCMYFNYRQLFEEKYEETIQNEPDYMQALMLKRKLLNIHFYSCTLFIVFHITFYFIMRFYFEEYRTIKFIFLFINYSDLIFLLLLTIIHYPIKLPYNYIEEDRDPMDPQVNNNEEGNIFRSIFFYALNKKDEEEYFKNYKKDECPNLVIIENPFSESKLDEVTKIEEENEENDKNNDNKGEEEQILIEKNINVDKINVINASEKDILDLTHSKLGFIDIS